MQEKIVRQKLLRQAPCASACQHPETQQMLFLTINRSQSIEITNGSQSRRPLHHETTTSLAVEAVEAAATGNHSLMPPNS